MKKTVGTTAHQYYYLGDKLVRLTIGSGTTMDFVYDASGNPYAVVYNGTTYYYVLNQQGDVVRIVTSGGTSYGTYRYDAWGKILYQTDNALMNANPLRYRGYVYDSETQLYYLNSRYYDPTLGRFINADALMSTGQGIIGNNMFVYCGNNPVNHSDPNGHAYRGIISQINYNEYEHSYGGLRENFYTLPSAATVDYSVLLVALNGATDHMIAKIIPIYSEVEAGVSFLSAYDQCRSNGLNYSDSIIGAAVSLVIPGRIAAIVGDSMFASSASAVTTNYFLDMYIAQNKPSASEAARNRTNHFVEKNAFVSVGGSMNFIAFGQLEVRDLHGQP